jgi:hypothetical protein
LIEDDRIIKNKKPESGRWGKKRMAVLWKHTKLISSIRCTSSISA